MCPGTYYSIVEKSRLCCFPLEHEISDMGYSSGPKGTPDSSLSISFK